LKNALHKRADQRRENVREFGAAITGKLREDGHVVRFDGRLNVLNLQEVSIRVRLLWPMTAEFGQAWRIRVERISRDVDFDLLVRMEDRFRPRDFFVAPPADVVVRFPQWMTEQVQTDLARFWCRSPAQLLEIIRTLNPRD
jgi:hypothetical protein